MARTAIMWIDFSSAELSFFKKDGNGWTKLADLRQAPRDPRMVPVLVVVVAVVVVSRLVDPTGNSAHLALVERVWSTGRTEDVDKKWFVRLFLAETSFRKAEVCAFSRTKTAGVTTRCLRWTLGVADRKGR